MCFSSSPEQRKGTHQPLCFLFSLQNLVSIMNVLRIFKICLVLQVCCLSQINRLPYFVLPKTNLHQTNFMYFKHFFSTSFCYSTSFIERETIILIEQQFLFFLIKRFCRYDSTMRQNIFYKYKN